MTTSSSPAEVLLPATRRALIRRVAVGQAEGRTPSLVGAVVREGRQVWCGGRSMLEGHEPDGNTQYRIGSLTKTFVAVLVMRLRDQGRLDLADPLGKYLDVGLNVTIAQLLSHTAGLASETPGPWWERTPTETLAEMRTPASPPGDDAWVGTYGLGLQLFRQDGRILAGHGGSMPGFLATLCFSPADHLAGITLANVTSGPDVSGIALDLVAIVADNEPRLPDRWAPLPEVDEALLALTGLWYWGPRAYALRLVAARGLELVPAGGRGRASRFRAEPDGTWTGLDGYYTGETLQVMRGADGTVGHLDLGSFVFTREPYGSDSPLAAQPDPEGWRAF